MLRLTAWSRSLALTALLSSASLAGGPAPAAWSPDGEWIGYVLDAPSANSPAPTDWFFDARLESAPVPKRPARSYPRGASRSRLWASKLGANFSVLLEESPGPITPPGWSPDGHALVFGRVIPPASGPGRYEVVLLEGTNRRVLLGQAIEDWEYDPTRLLRSAAAWSPDGRFVAVPSVRPAGLAILRTDNGRLVRTVESGSLPAWSPDGARLFYIGAGDQDRLECLERNLGVSRHLADLGRADGPPMVARDGQSVVVLCRLRLDRGPAGPAERVELARIHVEDGRRERMIPLLGGPQADSRTIVSTSLTQDRDGENFLSVLTLEGQPCQVAWYRTRDRGIYKLFPVLDPWIPASDLSLSPAGGSLAVRLGPPGAGSLPLVCDLETMLLTPLVPDESVRDAWIATLLDSAVTLLREYRPGPVVDGRGVERTVALPIVGEIEADSEPVQRLRRIGRIGKTVCDESATRPADPRRDEARFIFDYLREDFPAALADLEMLDSRDLPGDRRRRHLALRAQVYAGMGDLDRARGTLGYLKSTEVGRGRRVVEETSTGPQFTDDSPADLGWPDYAIAHVDNLGRAASKDDDDPTDPDDHRNPDAPMPGLGLDLPGLPPHPPFGGEAPPPPVIRPAPPGVRPPAPAELRPRVPLGGEVPHRPSRRLSELGRGERIP